MEKSQKVTLFSIIILLGFAFGVIYHYSMFFYLHKGGMSISFLYPSNMAFCDLFGVLEFVKDFKPYQELNMWTVYFPLTYLFMLPFAFIKNKVISYLLYVSGFVIYLTYMNIKMFACKDLNKLQNFQNIFTITLLSYPVLYCLDKGNSDIYLFILLGFWAYAFQKEKYGVSAFLLGLINAMKPFTLYFLLLYLLKKRYKEFFFSGFLTAFLVILGFMIIPDNHVSEVTMFFKSLVFYKEHYTLGSFIAMGFESSLFMPLKAILLHFTSAEKDIINFIRIYDYLCHFITIITLIFVWREKIFWKQLTLLICNFLLLPYITYDYKLIFLFIPIWMFINKAEKAKSDLAYLILFALLFVPKNIMVNFPLIPGKDMNWLSLSVIVNPIIIIILSGLIIYEQLVKQKNNLLEEEK